MLFLDKLAASQSIFQGISYIYIEPARISLGSIPCQAAK
jgi:hypothetical protein